MPPAGQVSVQLARGRFRPKHFALEVPAGREERDISYFESRSFDRTLSRFGIGNERAQAVSVSKPVRCCCF